MQFKDGKEAGHIDRVVIDPKTKEVTHVVVTKGWLFTEDKVVPVSWFGEATEDRVKLIETQEDLQALPEFEVTHFVLTSETEHPEGYAPTLYWYPPVMPYGPISPLPGYDPDQRILTERNIPEGTVPLKEGAKVISADGEHVGNLERIVTGPGTDRRATHIVISKGLLLVGKVFVPITWVGEIGEDEIRLVVRRQLLNRLTEREYSA